MRPMLKPAMRRSWRNRESLQFGVDPAHAVVLDPVDGAAAAFLDLLDGTRGLGPLAREAESLGLRPPQARRLLGLLAEGGVLDDATAHTELSETIRHHSAALDRLRPDLAALSVVHSDPGGAADRMGRRRAARVRVTGAGRVGATVAAVLSAAGVGRVDVRDGGRVEPWDTAPGGIPAEHIGERRDAAARGLVRRAAPDPRAAAVGRRGPSAAPEPGLSLVVVAPRDGLAAYAPDAHEAEPLMAAGIPHLYTGCWKAGEWWVPWWCRGARGARDAWDFGWPTPTRPGPGCWRSCGPAGAGSPPATSLWPPRSRGSPRRTRWPSSTAGGRRAAADASRWVSPG